MPEPLCSEETLLAALDSRENLLAFLRDELFWEIRLFWEFRDGKGTSPKIASLSADTPFPVYLVEFAERFPRRELRELLRGVRQRLSERSAELIFVCTTPDSVLFALYEERPNGQPQLRTFSFERDTMSETQILRTLNLPLLKLTPNCQETWRTAWSRERLTKQFLRDYKRVFETVRDCDPDSEGHVQTQHRFHQQMVNRFLRQKSAEKVQELDQFLFRYLFTTIESTPEDQEIAIDPEMLGTVFEELITGRHECGSYYTPRHVVQFMCREALKAYLAPCGAGIERLVDFHDASALTDPDVVLNALKSVKVVDPACGSGAYLLGMLRELATLHSLLLGLPPQDCKAKIIRNNLFGVDKDPFAVNITRLRLRLSLLPEYDECESHIVEGDSLQTQSGEFDIVLMNPPYLAASRVPASERKAFREMLDSLEARFGFRSDLYVYFFYHALKILKGGGIVCALTSGTFYTNQTKAFLRAMLLQHRLEWLIPLTKEVFSADVYSSITLAVKEQPKNAHYVRYLNLRAADTRLLTQPETMAERALTIHQNEYVRAYSQIFFEPTQQNRTLFETLLSERRLIDICRRQFAPLAIVAPALDTGIHSGNVRRKLFFRNLPEDKDLPRLLQGSQVVKYGVWWENPAARFYYVDVDYTCHPNAVGTGRGGRPSAHREYWHFCGQISNHHVTERLLMRQTEDKPYVGYISQGEERVYTDNTVHTLLLTAQGRELGITYRYLLAVLNSETLRHLYRAITQEEGRMQAQVKTGIANRLPVLIPTASEREHLETLVGNIQNLYEQHGLPAPDARIAEIQEEIDTVVCALYKSVLAD